jgi:glutathione synthase
MIYCIICNILSCHSIYFQSLIPHHIYYIGGEVAVNAAIQQALNNPNDYVLKPQREGGGNNFYREQMVEKIHSMSKEELSSYILMERIVPTPQIATMVRLGAKIECSTICELGVFGLLLRGGDGERLVNQYGGYLLRVKPVDADEGGVATG